jgi:rhodanese-related sulfurtransferase
VRSRRAAQFLKQADFPLVYSLAGGTAGWHEAGLPVITGDTSQTSVRLTEIVGPH